MEYIKTLAKIGKKVYPCGRRCVFLIRLNGSITLPHRVRTIVVYKKKVLISRESVYLVLHSSEAGRLSLDQSQDDNYVPVLNQVSHGSIL